MTAKKLEHEGYVRDGEMRAGLPIHVWEVALEVERVRAMSAAELVVLRLTSAGVQGLASLSEHMGLGSDLRLPERTLVRLLRAGAAVVTNGALEVTDVGRRWIADLQVTQRELVTCEVRLDPIRDAFEWMDEERPLHAVRGETWTIELADVGDDVLLRRKAELAELVRTNGLPDEGERGPSEKRPPTELRGVAIVSRRVHWRELRLEVWRAPSSDDSMVVAYVGWAEHPPLSQRLSSMKRIEKRRRFVAFDG